MKNKTVNLQYNSTTNTIMLTKGWLAQTDVLACWRTLTELNTTDTLAYSATVKQLPSPASESVLLQTDCHNEQFMMHHNQQCRIDYDWHINTSNHTCPACVFFSSVYVNHTIDEPTRLLSVQQIHAMKHWHKLLA